MHDGDNFITIYSSINIFSSQHKNTDIFCCQYTESGAVSKKSKNKPINELLSKGWETHHVSQIISSEKGWRRKI
jgi:hypothetical protein